MTDQPGPIPTEEMPKEPTGPTDRHPLPRKRRRSDAPKVRMGHWMGIVLTLAIVAVEEYKQYQTTKVFGGGYLVTALTGLLSDWKTAAGVP